VQERRFAPSVNTIGIDVGIKSFVVDSDGHREFNPAYFRQAEKQLRVRQRVLHRRIKNSNGRKGARVLVAKAHEKVSNRRDDFLHKVANYYVTNYGVIYIEDLNVVGMVKNHHLAKQINDSSWGKFFELLSYKAEGAGRKVVKVPRFEPTSKTCSECGAINHELTLVDRQWICKFCGSSHDRDYNAAKNIRRVGQTLQEQTYGNGQSVS
jgi:putative transposase